MRKSITLSDASHLFEKSFPQIKSALPEGIDTYSEFIEEHPTFLQALMCVTANIQLQHGCIFCSDVRIRTMPESHTIAKIIKQVDTLFGIDTMRTSTNYVIISLCVLEALGITSVSMTFPGMIQDKYVKNTGTSISTFINYNEQAMERWLAEFDDIYGSIVPHRELLDTVISIDVEYTGDTRYMVDAKKKSNVDAILELKYMNENWSIKEIADFYDKLREFSEANHVCIVTATSNG